MIDKGQARYCLNSPVRANCPLDGFATESMRGLSRFHVAALLLPDAEVVPLSDPRAQLPEMRLSRRTA
jgi:hypothetical protein